MTDLSDVIDSTKARLSGCKSAIRTMSILLMTRMTGLLRNKGLIEWNNLHWTSARKLVKWSEAYLSLDGVTTLFTQVHKVHDGTSQVGQSGNRLHLDRVHLFKRVVQDSWGVDNLPSEVFVIHVTDKQ